MLELQGRTLLAAVTTLTSLGFLLIGYDNGVLGGLVNGTAFNDTFNTPNPTIVGLIVAIYEGKSHRLYSSLTCGAVAASIFGEQLGRRKTIAIGVVVMILGAVLQAASYSRTQMIISRIVAGCGMGAINSTAPVLQAEFSPKTNRGL
ncbi:hypothetical protein MMC14_004327, partial [Varicellaria rhodocarpa]|nr:hypothetical protein [Varicellaria rhodocarpa]